jgi:hypothetical protein
MSNSIFKPFVEKIGNADAEEFIGNEGDLFYDPTTTTLRISDGETPGGNVVSGGGGGSSTPAPVLVSALPSAATAGVGATRFVTNANSRTFGAIVAAGDGTNTASITITGRQSMMEMGSVTFGSNGSSIQIANVAGDFLTALQAGVPIGSTLTASSSMGGTPSVYTLTSVFAYDAMAQGGSGAWVANTTPVSGATSPMSVNTITIVTPTTYTVPSPVYSDGTNWRIG